MASQADTPIIEIYGLEARRLSMHHFKINHEGLNQCYMIELSGTAEAPLPQVDGRWVQIKIGELSYAGIYHQLIQTYQGLNQWSFKLYLCSALEQMKHTHRQHTFQDKTLIDILQEILPEGLNARIELTQQLPIDYVVQGDVSDYDFFKRLCVQHQVIFYFEHHHPHQTIVFTSTLPDQQSIMLTHNPPNGLHESTAYVSHASRSRIPLPSSVQLTAYNILQPEQPFSAIAKIKDGREGRNISFYDKHHVTSQSECNMHAEHLARQLGWQQDISKLECTETSFYAGQRIHLSNRPDEYWRVVCVETTVNQSHEHHLAHRLHQTLYLIDDNCAFAEPEPVCRTSQPWLSEMLDRSYHISLASIEQGQVYKRQEEEGVIDATGNYRITRDHQTATPAIPMLQPSAGMSLNQIQGVHCPLDQHCAVALAHLDGNLERPVILGALPNSRQTGPVNNANRQQFIIGHHTHARLCVEASNEHQQKLSIETKPNQHGLYFEQEMNQHHIDMKSVGTISIFGTQIINIDAKSMYTHSQTLKLSAGDKLVIATQSTLTCDAQQSIELQAGHDILLEQQHEMLHIHSEQAQFGAQNIHTQAKQLHFQAEHIDSDGKNHLINSKKQLDFTLPQATMSLHSKGMNIEAKKITLNAPRLILCQDGAAN